ncbi:MAG: MBL fold metallo-hydrolase, partial [Candidatus Auribacterota bacterium]|nr:MBL fold metallo-hydrolase [Candidatus Auribacterota bacterium]
MITLNSSTSRRFPLFIFLCFIIVAAFSPGCDGRKEGESSVTVDYLDIDVKKFPKDQYNEVPLRADADKIIQAGDALKITFYGAARIVGGSCMLVEYKGKKILIDAGIFYMTSLIPLDKRFEFSPSSLDYVIITHAHGDHNARLPLLYKWGYTGKVFGTPPTKDISNIMLQLGAGMTSRRIRIDFRNRTAHNRPCEKSKALRPNEFIDVRSARAWLNNMNYHSCQACREMVKSDKAALNNKVEKWFQVVQPQELYQLADDIQIRLWNAGHILGSS